MSNAAVLFNLECYSAQRRAGFARVMNFIRRNASQKAFFSDALKLAYGSVSAKADVSGSAGVKVYLIDVVSPSGASNATWVQLFNVAQASVTLGTTKPDFTFQVPAGGVATIAWADGEGNPFPTALSWAATTANGGGTGSAAGDTPSVILLYE